ncbi:MAG: metallophosphoesterase family protein, partial [Chloroflexota bacterium]|nr:metallophosphoesterase family protein [Chloroflexota bacterium]
MRALVLSDIHANLEALEAVLTDAQNRSGFDVIWCLGDTVGYGPDPVACVDRIRE